MEGIQQLRKERDTLLNQQGAQLKADSSTIADSALSNLMATSRRLEQPSVTMQQVAGAALLVTLILAALISTQIARTIATPVKELAVATEQLKSGNYTVLVPQRDSSDIGQLAAAFNQMTGALQQQRAEVARQQSELAERNSHLERALWDLQEATNAREAMATTIRQLSVPVIPVLDRVLAIPLVGEIDEQRANILTERMLDGIGTHNARLVILDITGVPFIDRHLVAWLQRATNAAGLLGARCILVGTSPDVAQTLVAEAGSLANLVFMADLRSATAYARRTLGGGTRRVLAHT